MMALRRPVMRSLGRHTVGWPVSGRRSSMRSKGDHMRRSSLVVVLAAGVGLALAGSSEAKTSPHRLKCGHGYVLGSVRVPERKDGRIVRRHGQVVYTRVQRCVKVHKTNPPTTTTPEPNPGGSGNPVATSPPGTTTTTSTSTTTTTQS